MIKTTNYEILVIELNKTYAKVKEEDISRVQAEIFNSTQPSHRAPEQLDLQQGYPINEKVDVWALGVTLYNMMYFKMPFTKSEKANQIEAAVSFPHTYSPQLEKLCK